MHHIERKILENGYVKLVPLDESHRWQLRDAVMQTTPESWTYMMKDARADFDGWFKNLLEQHSAGKQHVFVVVDKASNRFVGASSLMNVEAAHDRMEIGNTWYVPEAQGTAVNPAAKLALMSYAFEEAGAYRLELKSDALNAHSRRAMRKLGATEEGTLRGHMLVPDHKGGIRHRDTTYFSILEPEWQGIKQNLEARLRAIEPKTTAPAREAHGVLLA